ncbi:MAG: 2-phospho-L-lactate transferase CofD family protein, partial [Aggregatilineales bacterium]
MAITKNIVVIVGGVGGAKLALGLSNVVAPENLTIIVNTGDDFWHYGLKICPDIDTVLYTLSDRADREQGWGLTGDTTAMLDTLAGLGEDPWFRLGDKDLATHLLRTHLLREGYTLTQVIADLASRMGIAATVLPM